MLVLSSIRFYGEISIFFLIFLSKIKCSESYSYNDANNLHTALFANYNKHVLPEHPLIVEAEYNILTINYLDMKTQTLSTSGWFTVIWNDTRLVWDRSNYGNMEHIYVTQDKLWHPELIVENSVINLKNLGEDDTQIRIQYDGKMRWEPPALLSTSCDMDVTFFPYDHQECPIELASWGFPTSALNMTFYKSQVNLLDYRTNGEWELISTKQHPGFIVEDDLVFSELVFELQIKRLPGYYIMSVIFPVIVTAVLTSVTFLLPVESGEKVGYILTVLLSLAVLLTLFSNSMPTTSKHTSILVIFLTMTLGLSALAIILTVLVIKLHYKQDDSDIGCLHTLARRVRSWSNKSPSDHTTHETNTPGPTTPPSVKMNAWSEKGPPQDNGQSSNADLARVIDNLCFVFFATVYFFVVIGFTFTLGFSG